ncbi:hypothetical protein V1294_006067 [Bradyrhizobium sp. AZCC 1678]
MISAQTLSLLPVMTHCSPHAFGGQRLPSHFAETPDNKSNNGTRFTASSDRGLRNALEQRLPLARQKVADTHWLKNVMSGSNAVTLRAQW